MMKFTNSKEKLPLLIIAIFIALAIFSSIQVTTAQEPIVPAAPPDAEVGLAIFAERCAVCHGPLGAGDGEQALSAGLEPRNFTDPAYQLETNPQRMFEIISNGSMVNGMPPFGPGTSNPLSEEDMGHLLAAIYSFGTPQENIEVGETLFAGLGGTVADIPGLDYWFTRSNQDVLADLDAGDWPITAVSLSEADKEALVDYGRAQSYTYANPLAAFEPIENATIGGIIVNGSTSVPVNDVEAVLRAFTPDFRQTLIMTTTTDVDGNYSFDLTDVSPEWVFLTSTDYNDLVFNSPANVLTRAEPELSLPIIVYDTTNDPSLVSIAQIHMIFNFVADGVEVSELYIFNNDANAVFMGETDDPQDGVLHIQLPAGVANVSFQRAMGSLDRFGPAPEVVQTETGWSDTLPLRPGSGSTSLLVGYDLPYEDGLGLGHPLSYELNGATVIYRDNGVTLSGDGWLDQGSQNLNGENFVAYANNALSGAQALSLQLDGRPQQLLDSQGNAVLIRNDNQEMLIGLMALGLVMVVGVFTVRSWQQPTAVAQSAPDSQAFLQAIAELDDKFEAGELDEKAYTQERENLKEALRAIWPQTVT